MLTQRKRGRAGNGSTPKNNESEPTMAARPRRTGGRDARKFLRGGVRPSQRLVRNSIKSTHRVRAGGFGIRIIKFSRQKCCLIGIQVNLKISLALASCFNWSMEPSVSELVVFARVSDPAVDLETTPPDGPWLEATAAAVPWSLGVDIAIWNAVGWAGWGEWGPCSRTCAGGVQTRRRYCSRASCEGYGEQFRTCNTFDCLGAVNTLAPSARRNFHPAQAHWARVADRPHAFTLRPNSYIWIASSELFAPGRTFPKEFTLFVSLRLRPESGGYGQGTLFSLRSRRRAGAFLSLELAGRGAARLVHAASGATRLIYLAVPLYDFRWHHIAISVHDDNTVRAYVDCRWLRTDVLEKGALDTPKDADLIIGYLFSRQLKCVHTTTKESTVTITTSCQQGDLEQLVLVPQAGQAQNQCSSQAVGAQPQLAQMRATKKTCALSSKDFPRAGRRFRRSLMLTLNDMPECDMVFT
ncbi:Semaphorin-5B [Eumeta japonica]|uniref:Semaphorin-5B n=1 Tax=Eumeta variegata TaxID=151549 RepID=A0A4C1SHZ8_EUMVA|nr:Semaphorin-5B [Eumeta japonica]